LTRKTTILNRKYEIPDLYHLLKHKRKLRKLWQETRDPAYKMAVSQVTQNIRRMVRKRALERWETELANFGVTPQAIWPIAKSLSKSCGPNTTSAIHHPLGPIFYPNDKANIIADCLENQFRMHDLCDCDHRRHVEAQVEALLATINGDIPVNFQPCDVVNEIQSLELGKAYGFVGIPNESLQHLSRRPPVYLTHLCNHCLGLGHFPAPQNEAKVISTKFTSDQPLVHYGQTI
jgi:hypothetical protein